MAGNARAVCPLTGSHCEGRQALIDLQTQIDVEAAACQPNIITDGDSRAMKIAKRLVNMASSTTTSLTVRGLNDFSEAIDIALDTEPTACNGNLCGAMGNLVVAYGRTFMPEASPISFGKKQ